MNFKGYWLSSVGASGMALALPATTPAEYAKARQMLFGLAVEAGLIGEYNVLEWAADLGLKAHRAPKQ